MNSKDSEDNELRRYRQAADVAYRYAKERLDRKQSSDKMNKEETDVNQDIKKTEDS